MLVTGAIGVYGTPPPTVVDVPADAIQFSPLMPGAASLDDAAGQSLDAIVILAPPGTLERRYTLALALRALKAGGLLTALAPKDRGGARLRKELTEFGCYVTEEARSHHRIVTCARPAAPAIEGAIDDGKPRIAGDLGLWSQPGVFSWDRLDAGTEMLIEHLPQLAGRGADFGCGIGVLARAVLTSPKVTEITLVDIDRRAIACAEHNVVDPRARFLWADVRKAALTDLDFVVMNAPFHDAGAEDRRLAQNFVQRAAEVLHKGGVLWLVANRHLPYEAILTPTFKRAELIIETAGYKIYEAHK